MKDTGTSNNNNHDCNRDALFVDIFTKFNSIFCERIKPLIAKSPAGISEYELLKQLKATNSQWKNLINFSDSKALFPIHFLLFNALYAWQEELLQKNNVQLSVSALNIRLDNRPSETNSIGEYDSIRYFYLARENLFKTSASDLDAMLTSFWKRNMVQPEVIIAFEVLEISPTTDLKEIKRAYRKKIAVTHPDKGGCTRKAMDVNQALDVINTALGT